MASTLVEKARQGAVIVQIKASLMDHKDIRSRYIRVRYDGKTVQLAGFVQSKKQGELAVEIAKQQGEKSEVITCWSYEKDLNERNPYKTRVREQVSDAEIWRKVCASLSSPAAKSILAHADVRHGIVRVFLILDGPPENPDITPYVKPISGVVDLNVLAVKVYEDATQ